MYAATYKSRYRFAGADTHCRMRMPYGVTGRTRTGGLVIPNQARCHLRYCHILPVSPGCQAAASVFALTPITSGCPASVFPSGFAVSQGLAPCGPTSGHGCAPCGRCTYMAKCRLAPLISLRSKRRNRIRKERPLGSGIPPAAAPSFRGVKKEKLHEVSRFEPSGQGISPEPCTTHGFGVGGSAGGRTRVSWIMSPVLCL